MKNLLLLFSVLITFNGQSQIDIPFPDSTGAWVMTGIGYGSPWDEDIYWPYRNFVDGDTMIASKNYTKIWEGNSNILDTTFFLNLVGYYRVDSLKVFYLHAFYLNEGSANGFPMDTVEYLLYDFGIQPGDTFDLAGINTGAIVLDSIDSVMFNGNYYRRFNFNPNTLNYYSPHPIYWIEGIGSSTGIFPFLLYFENDLIFHCFHENDDSFAFNLAGGTSCFDIPLSISEAHKSNIDVYPNPVSDYLIIENKNASPAVLQIYDLFGMLLLDVALNDSINEIDLSMYSEGSYLVTLYSQNESVHQKIVKQ